MTSKKRVLILCTGNSCRSQMAEGLARHFFGEHYEIESAGTAPSIVNPKAIQVMAELGIDISQHRSKSVNEFIGQPFDYVMTVCGYADQHCPVFPGKATRIHWGFEDPYHATGDLDQVVNKFREVRDAIQVKFQAEWREVLK